MNLRPLDYNACFELLPLPNKLIVYQPLKISNKIRTKLAIVVIFDLINSWQSYLWETQASKSGLLSETWSTSCHNLKPECLETSDSFESKICKTKSANGWKFSKTFRKSFLDCQPTNRHLSTKTCFQPNLNYSFKFCFHFKFANPD